MATVQWSDAANERTSYPSGILGANPEARSLQPAYGLAERCWGTKNTEWMYVKAGAAIASGATPAAPVQITVSTAGAASAGSGGWYATAPFAANEYGWAYRTSPTVDAT